MHPSLPAIPRWSVQQSGQSQQHHQQQQRQQQYPNVPSVPSNNPANNSNSFYSAHSSHYAQAYLQPAASTSTNHLGYTYSSAYVVSSTSATPQPLQFSPQNPNAFYGLPSQNHNSNQHRVGQPSRPTGAWYQPGPTRCSHPGCSFTGSAKSVEIHKMDRHLIYPPGYEERKEKTWDADPSLKGKPILIQGTSITLTTPESIDAWIAERKRRWPTAEKVAEKKRKLEEAVERGQLTPFEAGLKGPKRARVERGAGGEGAGRGERGRGRGRGRDERGRGRGRGRGGMVSGAGTSSSACEASSQAQPPPFPSTSSNSLTVPPRPIAVSADTDSSSEDDDDDAPPEAVSSKVVPQPSSDPTPTTDEPPNPPKQSLVPLKKPPPRRAGPNPTTIHNPFARRTNLLHQLLLPEVRITISNLSQAIRFLVDNDFLEGVELKPGQAEERMIDVVADSAAGSVGSIKEERGDIQVDGDADMQVDGAGV